MDILNQFVKNINVDEESRILVSFDNSLEVYLQDKNIRKMIKDTLEKSLDENFIQLEVGKNICRVTVKEGTQNESIEIIKEELIEHIQMALSFMSQMQNSEDK